ncbi:reverse transcriptase domain-containing protein [Tanacetum coccineum]
MTSDVTYDKEINKANNDHNEPSGFQHDEQKRTQEVVVENESPKVQERTLSPSMESQQPSIHFPNRILDSNFPRRSIKNDVHCPYETIAYRRMPLDKMLARCEETNLVRNREKCHFMVKEGIVLGDKISSSGIEVVKAKIDVIAKLPYPTNVKGVRSFLGHAGFYHRFVKDFAMISRPMTQLLLKDVKFDFSDDCKKAFNILKEKLTTTPIIISLDWKMPFELMCDASDFAVGVVLGQQIDRKFKPFYYASKTLNNAQEYYTTTEKELLVVVFAFDKLRPYLILIKTVVYIDHSALKYLFNKQDAGVVSNVYT